MSTASRTRFITCYVPAAEPEVAHQARAAAVATAVGEGLVLVGAPHTKKRKIGRQWFWEYTWEAARPPEDLP